MHPQLVAALDRLDAVTRDLRAIAEAVPVPARGQRPSPERWSVNEVIEHVAIVEQLFLQALVATIDDARVAGLAAEVAEPPMLPDHLRTAVENRTKPRNAPERARPGGRVDAPAGLQAIEAGHARLRDALQSADGLALSTVTYDHPFFGTLNVYQWIDFLAGHERRHAAQLREVAAQIA